MSSLLDEIANGLVSSFRHPLDVSRRSSGFHILIAVSGGESCAREGASAGDRFEEFKSEEPEFG